MSFLVFAGSFDIATFFNRTGLSMMLLEKTVAMTTVFTHYDKFTTN